MIGVIITLQYLKFQGSDIGDPRIDMMTSAKSVSGRSPIFNAAFVGNEERVKQLIEEGANPLDKDKHNNTLLDIVAMMGRLNILRYLIEDKGCNPGTEGGEGMTVLHVAAESNQFHIVQYLVNECQMDPSALDNYNRSPLTHACRHSNLEMATFLTESTLEYMKKEDVFYSDYTSVAHLKKIVISPLCVACFHGHLPIVKYLIEECGCDPFKPEGGNYKSPLLSAVCGNHVDIVKYFAGMNNIQIFGPTAQELSLVDIAIINKSLEMVKLLTLSFQCDPVHTKNGITTLHAAAKLGQLSILSHLLSLKCDPNVRGWCGRQPIHEAAVKGHLNIVQYLVEKQHCDPSSGDINGTTPLYLAASDGHLSIVRYLTLQHKCDPLHPEFNSSTSVDAATVYGHVDVIRFFIKELKCNLRTTIVPPLYAAALSGNLEMAKLFMDELGCSSPNRQQAALLCCQLPMLKYLIEEKQQAAYKRPAINYVALSGNLDMVEYLSHENVYSMNSSSRAPLDIAMFIREERRCQYTVDKTRNLVVCKVTYDGYMTIGGYIMRKMVRNCTYNHTSYCL